MNRFEVGEDVRLDSRLGTVVEVCSGKLSGMLVIRLERGTVCIDAKTVTLEKLQEVTRG